MYQANKQARRQISLLISYGGASLSGQLSTYSEIRTVVHNDSQNVLKTFLACMLLCIPTLKLCDGAERKYANC